MTLYALKDPDGKIHERLAGDLATARRVLVTNYRERSGEDLWVSDWEVVRECRAARKLGWRIVKVRVLEGTP